MSKIINRVLCPLCNSNSNFFFQNKSQLFFKCHNCHGIFLSKDLLPDSESEKTRYMEHNNDVNDREYHKFVSPIVNSIFKDFLPKHEGLDFGAGTGPVISKLLNDQNYKILQYDPFFHYLPELLKKKYDYIACCEVIEHFFHPEKEFKLLKSLLNENGKLYCMTKIYNQSINFENWYYKNDNTHVFFYQLETIDFIAKTFGFSDVKINDNLIIFTS